MGALYYLQLLLILGAATVLACWCGWGVTRLATPPALRQYRGLLAPLIGYALVVVAGYWGVRTVVGLPVVLGLLFSVTGALNMLAWRRTGPPRLDGKTWKHLPLVVLLLITLLVGVAPLLQYNHPAIIGAGWDTENYLPTARYLERGPVSAIAGAPPNPLRDINAHPPSIGLTLGFSVWQGSVDLLARSEAITSFAPLLAWLRTLGMLGVYVLLRATLGLERPAALLGTAFASAGSLLLWVSYFNFGMQLSAWPLIPLGLVFGVATVEHLAERAPASAWRAWPSLVVAAFVLAALPVAYYPALTLWGPLAAGLGAAMLIQSVHRLRLLLAAAVLAVLAVTLATPTVVDYGQGFDYRYGAQLTTLGLFRYIPSANIAGLTPFALDESVVAPWTGYAGAGLVVLGLLMLAGLLGGPRRLRWIGVGLGGLGYLVWLRWGQAYPYAYMKGASYVAFVFLGLAAAGWQALAARMPARLRLVSAVAPLALLGMMIASQSQVIAAHWEEPGLYADELPALLELRRLVPPGSTVTLSSDPRLEGVTTGLAAHMLDHATVWGQNRTGYSFASSGEADAIGAYGLLHVAEDPRPWGYDQLIWRGGPWALYKRPDGVLAHLRPGRDLLPGQPITLAIGDQRLALDTAPLSGGADRRLELVVAALQPGELRVGDSTFTIPAGESRVRLGSVPTPQTLVLESVGGAPVLLRTATLTSDVLAENGVEPIRASLVARARAEVVDTVVTTTIEAALPDSGPVALALDIWDLPGGVHYGWYGVELGTSDTSQTFSMALDLRGGTIQALGVDGAPLPVGARFDGLREGSYVARLVAGAGPLELSTPVDLFAFNVHGDGSIAEARGGSGTLVTTTNRPPHVLDMEVGEELRLIGYDVPESSIQPGTTVSLLLWWEAKTGPLDTRSVLVHLLDARGEKVLQADGPPAKGARPTESWRQGEVILDWRELALPADLPSGEYTLAIGMYRWPSLERLPVTQAGTPQEGDVVRIPLRVAQASSGSGDVSETISLPAPRAQAELGWRR